MRAWHLWAAMIVVTAGTPLIFWLNGISSPTGNMAICVLLAVMIIGLIWAIYDARKTAKAEAYATEPQG
jgi:hypothetical protein